MIGKLSFVATLLFAIAIPLMCAPSGSVSDIKPVSSPSHHKKDIVSAKSAQDNGARIEPRERIGEGSLEVGATVIATILSITITIAAILFQIDGYPLQLICRLVLRDVYLWGLSGTIGLTLFAQIYGLSLPDPRFAYFRDSAGLIFTIGLIAVGGVILRLLKYVELKPFITELAHELVDTEI